MQVKDMKKINIFILLFAALAVFFAYSSVSAQDEMPTDAPKSESRRSQRRPNLLQELGLTPEQTKQIRQLNVERKPLQQQAQQRVREAMRNLDQAIYADTVNEAEIQNLLKELQTAQAEMARLRATSELEVRKILTPEQLVKFRDLRRRFAEMRENFDERREHFGRDVNKNAQNRRFNRHLRRIRGN
jgi:Spy/CpxP family protein refolding chaperone